MSNSYAIDSIAANPYFQMAYNSPNFYGVGAAQSVPQTAATVNAAAEGENKPVTQPKAEKKDNTTAKIILGTVAVAGAALLCRKAYKMGKGTGFWSKLGNGFQEMGSSITNWGKGVKNKVVNPEKFSVTKVGEETVCTIPNKRNIIKGAEELKQIAATSDVPKIFDEAGKLAEGIKIKSGTFDFGGKKYIVNNGKIIGCEGMTKDTFKEFFTNPKTTENIKSKTETLKELAKFLKGETGSVTRYSHTQDGVARLFERTGTAGKPFKIKCGISDKFNVNSDAVQAYVHDNPTLETVLKGFAENKTDGLKLASAQYTRDDLGTLFINNGEITAIKWTDGQTYKKGSEKWKALVQTNKEIYENILKDTNCLQNKVYQRA